MQHHQQDWLEERKAAVMALLQTLSTRTTQKHIYQIRQELKKIRAAFLWKNSTGKPEFEKEFIELQKIFKLAGRIRAIYVAIRRLSTLPAGIGNDALIFPFEKSLANAMRKWKKYCNNPSTMKAVDKELDDWLTFCLHHRTMPTRVAKTDQRMRLNGIPEKLPEWHAYRKRLKQWIYGHEASIHATMTLSPEKLHQIDRMQQAIGDWHDWQDVLLMLEKLRKRIPAADYYLARQQIQIMAGKKEAMIAHELGPELPPEQHG